MSQPVLRNGFETVTSLVKQRDCMSEELKNAQLSSFLQTAEHAALKAGKLLVSKMGQVTVQEKNPRDYVTQADIESQELIQNAIHAVFPDHGFLGEESDNSSTTLNQDSPFCWIVDPLDGTTNFIHQLRSFSVSIGLRYKNEMIVGCVHDPLSHETYSAAKGLGAHLNGQPITTSKTESTNQSIVVCSLPGQLTRESDELKQLINVLCDSHATVRRLGSAALNLSYIACGRIDSYWSTLAKIWDIAAGVVILQEAGGVITNIAGEALDWDDLNFVASASNKLNDELINHLKV